MKPTEILTKASKAASFMLGTDYVLRKLGAGIWTRSAVMGVGGSLAGLVLDALGHTDAGRQVAIASVVQSACYAAIATGLADPLEPRIVKVAPYYAILYGSSSLTNLWANQKPLAITLNLRGIVLHGSDQELINEGPTVVADIRRTLPNCDIWYELEDDAGPANSAAQLIRRLNVAGAADANRIPVLSLDREQRWKTGGPGFSADDARKSIDAIRAKYPLLALMLTNYDQPTLHMDFPWEANAGVDVYGPEVYGIGPQGEYTRFVDHARSWATARKLGIVSGAPTYPFVPAGGITYTETCWMADGADTILFWVFAPPGTDDRFILDEQGKTAILLLNALADAGYTGRGRVARFQRDKNLSEIDGKIGPITRAALRV